MLNRLDLTPDSSNENFGRLGGSLNLIDVRIRAVDNYRFGIRYLLWQLYRSLIWFRLMVELASGKGGVYTADMVFRLIKLKGR